MSEAPNSTATKPSADNDSSEDRYDSLGAHILLVIGLGL
jgi:hypothetical protein